MELTLFMKSSHTNNSNKDLINRLELSWLQPLPAPQGASGEWKNRTKTNSISFLNDCMLPLLVYTYLVIKYFIWPSLFRFISKPSSELYSWQINIRVLTSTTSFNQHRKIPRKKWECCFYFVLYSVYYLLFVLNPVRPTRKEFQFCSSSILRKKDAMSIGFWTEMDTATGAKRCLITWSKN